MRSFFAVLLCMNLVLAGCRKDATQIPQHIPATPEHLASINAMLKGTWAYTHWEINFQNVSGIPGENTLPIDGSMSFDGQANNISRFDYSASPLASLPYELSGADGIDYITVTKSATDIRKCKIALLTSDSLVLQNTLTGQDTSRKLSFTEVWAKSGNNEVDNKLFRITITSASGYLYSTGATITIYRTPAGGAENILYTQTDVTQNYSYSFAPSIGDHIRMTIRNNTGGPPDEIYNYYSRPATLAYYKGCSFGNGWQALSVSAAFDQNWDINN